MPVASDFDLPWELPEEKFNFMLSFPISDKQGVYGIINVDSTTMKRFSEDEIYFVSIIANPIVSAVKLRKRFASGEPGRA